VDSTTSSKASASALKTHVDLSLVAERDGRVNSSNRAHNKSAIDTRVSSPNRAHNKSAVDPKVLPNLSAAERARALRLAERLASSHSD
jgi:hypothetical protein